MPLGFIPPDLGNYLQKWFPKPGMSHTRPPVDILTNEEPPIDANVTQPLYFSIPRIMSPRMKLGFHEGRGQPSQATPHLPLPALPA